MKYALAIVLFISTKAFAADPDGICRSAAHVPENTVQCPPRPLPNYAGARSDPGLPNGPIDVWNKCRYIDNITANISLFVPFHTAFEWVKFIENHPPTIVSLNTCAKPTEWVINSQDSAQLYLVELPYDPTGTIYKPDVITFPRSRQDCNASGQCNTTTWNETHTTTFQGLNSDVVTPSWKLVSDIVSPAPPPNPPVEIASNTNTDVTCHGGKDSTCADSNGGADTSSQHGGNYPNQNDGTDVTAGMARDSGSDGGGGSNTTGNAGQ